jgi:hypothetical protein
MLYIYPVVIIKHPQLWYHFLIVWKWRNLVYCHLKIAWTNTWYLWNCVICLWHFSIWEIISSPCLSVVFFLPFLTSLSSLFSFSFHDIFLSRTCHLSILCLCLSVSVSARELQKCNFIFTKGKIYSHLLCIK